MSLRTFAAAFISALALLATGCPAPASTSPAVLSFTASESRVAAGGEVTLRWKVERATSLSLSEAGSGSIESVAQDAFDASTTVKVERSSVYVLTARGEHGSDTRLLAVDVLGEVRAPLFRSTPETIEGGKAATLIWSLPGQDAVAITDDAGSALPLKGQGSSGSIEVSPTKTTAYTLSAGSHSLTTTVKVRPAVLEFRASSPTAKPGEPVTLSWRTAGAAKVTLTAAGRGELTSTTSASAGTFTDTLPSALPLDGVVAYTLTVDGEGGPATRTLDVYASGGLSIQTFSVARYARAGGLVPLSWWTSGADSVEVLVDGAVVYRTPTSAEAAQGSHSVVAPDSDFAVQLRATSTRGEVATSNAGVELATPPLSATLTSDVSQVSAGAKATLTWSAPNARRAVIRGSDGVTVLSVFGPDAEGGTVEVTPNETLTYTLSADATVGDPEVTASVVVALTGARATLSTTPRGTPVVGVLVPLSYGSAPGTLLHGLPHTQVLVNSVSGFEDISDSGQRLVLSQTADDEVLTFDPKFETWLFSSRVFGKVTVSTNGFFHFGESTQALPVEHAFPNANIPANLVAPFWDDLRMKRESGLFWEVKGDAPERRLIVQWSHLQVGADTNTDVTFQAQVHQTGRVVFAYASMRLPTPNHWAFSAGIQGGARERGIGRTATPASNSSVDFFAPVANGTPVTMWPGIAHRGFVKVGKSYLHLDGPRAARLSDLAITEVMAQPSVAQGQYVELHNRGPIPLELTDWQLSASGGQAFSFDGGTVPAGGLLVVGTTTDRSANDDAGVQLSWPAAFALSTASSGGAALTYAADAGVAVSWDGGVSGPGLATAFDPGPFLVTFNPTPGSSSCSATGTFGAQTPPQQGSPGRLTGCGFAYRLEEIPGAFFDISTTGTRVFSGSGVTTTKVTLPTGSGPLPLIYRQPRQDVWVSMNGWLLYASTAGSPVTGTVNDLWPSATPQLQGMLAPLWDVLYPLPFVTDADVYWKRTAQGEDPSAPAPHWIFQWHRLSFWLAEEDEASFQIKLFDDGVIEYHYGAMKNRSTANLALGSSATVWLSNPFGTQALVVGVNSPVIVANSGFRFRPQP